MKVEDPSALLVQWFYHKHKVLPERRRVLMAKLYQICCPKCNNKTDFYRYGKNVHGRQKYQCKKCRYQWAENHLCELTGCPRTKEFLTCPVCGKAMYVHHNRDHYIPLFLHGQQVQALCLCAEAYGYFIAVHVQTVR